ncbi:hypothetical protein PVAP13_5NG283034 [Panicum virgatum]|uniref:Uncharacterized protein n=1 Tax=Panicum virgatum TaxID=38727 RepID=A0A8T0RXD7_PANVG|nr:hypothetical protein PVAP13_5NG283034 [Panicum virgatum]
MNRPIGPRTPDLVPLKPCRRPINRSTAAARCAHALGLSPKADGAGPPRGALSAAADADGKGAPRRALSLVANAGGRDPLGWTSAIRMKHRGQPGAGLDPVLLELGRNEVEWSFGLQNCCIYRGKRSCSTCAGASFWLQILIFVFSVLPFEIWLRAVQNLGPRLFV